jgi:hypothetical protein
MVIGVLECDWNITVTQSSRDYQSYIFQMASTKKNKLLKGRYYSDLNLGVVGENIFLEYFCAWECVVHFGQ